MLEIKSVRARLAKLREEITAFERWQRGPGHGSADSQQESEWWLATLPPPRSAKAILAGLGRLSAASRLLASAHFLRLRKSKRRRRP